MKKSQQENPRKVKMLKLSKETLSQLDSQLRHVVGGDSANASICEGTHKCCQLN